MGLLPGVVALPAWCIFRPKNHYEVGWVALLLEVVWIAWCAARVVATGRQLSPFVNVLWGVVIFLVLVALNVVIYWGLLLASCAVLTGGYRI